MTADGERTLEYDARGRLSRVVRTTGSGTIPEEYVYGWDDERVIKRSSGAGAASSHAPTSARSAIVRARSRAAPT